jgi:8-oxo-dGTP pyrophosphatase MutT (NUDIX family)
VSRAAAGRTPVEAPWSGTAHEQRRLALPEAAARCRKLPDRHRSYGFTPLAAVPAAALILLSDQRGEAAVTLTRRPGTMVYSAGDWVFPGGRCDPSADADPGATALREAQEELGISRDHVELLGRLGTYGPFMTGFVLDVFVAAAVGIVRLDPHPEEVAEVRIVELGAFGEAGCCSEGPAPRGYQPGPVATTAPGSSPARRASSIRYFTMPGGDVVWGAQADILWDLLAHLWVPPRPTAPGGGWTAAP